MTPAAEVLRWMEGKRYAAIWIGLLRAASDERS